MPAKQVQGTYVRLMSKLSLRPDDHGRVAEEAGPTVGPFDGQVTVTGSFVLARPCGEKNDVVVVGRYGKPVSGEWAFLDTFLAAYDHLIEMPSGAVRRLTLRGVHADADVTRPASEDDPLLASPTFYTHFHIVTGWFDPAEVRGPSVKLEQACKHCGGSGRQPVTHPNGRFRVIYHYQDGHEEASRTFRSLTLARIFLGESAGVVEGRQGYEIVGPDGRVYS